MFGRHLEVKFVKDKHDYDTYDATPRVTSDDVERIAKKIVKYVAVGAAATFAAVITMNTASEIVVNRMSIESKKEE